MPRIYALAKELKLDSKKLVDICAKAGVMGKGSALASLSDDEVDKLKSYLGGVKTSPNKAATPKPDKPSSSSTSFTRDDYIAPGGTAGGDDSPAKESQDSEEAKKDSGPKTPVKKAPVVKLAAMPTTTPTPPPSSPNEPAPQKPIMTLPPDALRKGDSAPLGQFTRQEKRRKSDQAQEPAPSSPPDSTPQPDTPLSKSTGRRRRENQEVQREATAEDKELARMATARQARQQNRKSRRSGTISTGGDDASRRRRSPRARQTPSTAAPRKGNAILELPCTVRSFSEATGIPNSHILKCLMDLGLGTLSTLNINSSLEDETAELLSEELELNVEFKQEETLEDAMLASVTDQQDDAASLISRPPVITFLGHVDHGKTSLLDRIIGSSVVDGEAGGITQHIRAYVIDKDNRKISFVDTPGHEAFTEMRARGANVTDIAVLVVAADDGVMPQTEEAISHARAAEVPIIVALNKVDLPSANLDKAMSDLSNNGLLPAEWGGDVEVVKTSAETGEGIDELLETILITSDLNDYKSNPDRDATGTCLEAEQEGQRGVVAKLIVQNGTLRVGDVVVCGAAYGRIKAMYDTLRPKIKITEANPSTPVNITGLDVAPDAGEAFYVLDDISKAREIAALRERRSRHQALGGQTAHISFEDFQRRLEEGRLVDSNEVVTMNLILRADVQGSIEAIQKELGKLDHPEVKIKILQSSVGGITVADVTLASASGAVIVGFNVIPDESARTLADDRSVEIRRYDIIYKVTDDIKLLLEGKLKPEERITELGRVLVKQVFSISRLGKIAGCHIVKGTVERGCRIRVNREGRGIGEYPLDSLRREKEDVKNVREGFECGIKLSGFNDFKEGDILEAFKVEEVARTLD